MILQRYIGLSVGKGWVLVMVVLGAIFGLISFTQELEHAEAPYNTLAVARYTLLILPNQLVSLAPVVALLGTIVALSSLDRFNELTIVSCAGFSPSTIALAPSPCRRRIADGWTVDLHGICHAAAAASSRAGATAIASMEAPVGFPTAAFGLQTGAVTSI